ncbi:pentatricopeptide repeat-containing protein At2g13600-like [Typha latifolia]|uniref:pentatricopeptide repeat-containing protein At2g13600-like n=1 Tax=Typha latifolia TaxID=4733 RepID=UPI003C2CC880
MRARAKRVLLSRETSSFSLLSAFKSFKKKAAIAVGPFSSTKRAFKSYAETCASLLRRCTAIPDLRGPLGLALHAQAIRSGISADSSVSTKLLTMYSAWGCLADRDRIFSEAFHAFDLFSFNFMIAAYCRSGHLNAARDLFDRMPERNAVTWTAMLDGLMKHGCVSDAVELYKRNPFRTVISSTAMISGFVHNELYYEALITSRSMLASGLMPNEVTFTCVIKACIGGGEFGLAESVLGLIVKTNFEQHLSVRNSLITLFLRMDNVCLARRVFDEMEEKDVVSWTAILDVYAEMGDLKEAHRILDEMPKRNEVSWSTMIARYDQNGDASEAIRMFALMLSDGCRPNISCFSSVLSASANLKYMLFGAGIHCHALKVGFDSNVFVASSLVNMYSKCGKSDDAHLVFDLLPEKNIVSWNSMVTGYSNDGRMEKAEQIFGRMPARNIASWNAIISGYAQNGHYAKALEAFDAMLVSGQTASQVTFSSVLHACASLSWLEKGKYLHSKVVKLGIQNDVFMGTALVDMYAKSGDIESCKRVFSRMPEKNEVSWTAMIQGLADNGLAQESIPLFEEMRVTETIPTEYTFLSVLLACARCGLVDKALHYFESMQTLYGISPEEKHYTCMVDVLARAGHLREAEEFLGVMPIKAEANGWAALLSACSTYQNEEIGERAAKKLHELEKENAAGYVLLSNVYASSGKWKDVARVRTLMRGIGIKKGGGCSWIQTRDQFHTFFSWDVKHQMSSEIYEILVLLMWELSA